jgi:hypothetical protein
MDAQTFTIKGSSTIFTVTYVGYYQLGETCIKLKKKPDFIKRYFMKHLLGFNWVNQESKEQVLR